VLNFLERLKDWALGIFGKDQLKKQEEEY